MTMVRVKICGIRRVEDALAAIACGADFIGIVLAPSRRRVPLEVARDILATCRREAPGSWAAVGVFADMPLEEVRRAVEVCGFDVVQLCGGEDRDYCLSVGRPVFRAVHIPVDSGVRVVVGRPGEYGAERLVLDARVPGLYGGTGVRFPWEFARAFAEGNLVAGGLTPENVGEAVRTLGPWGVDVSSGVERDGWKDPHLMRAFVEAARSVR